MSTFPILENWSCPHEVCTHIKHVKKRNGRNPHKIPKKKLPSRWISKQTLQGKKRHTGINPSKWVDWTIFPILKTSLSIILLQVLHAERDDFAYSAFHGFGGFAISATICSFGCLYVRSCLALSMCRCWCRLYMVESRVVSHSPEWRKGNFLNL